MKKNYNCLDVLKFVMALLIVMIHVQPNQHSEPLQHFFHPFLNITVPVFFVCSSILLFKKIGDAKNGEGIFLHFCKRLGLLYITWLLIDSWFIIYRKSYFQEDLINGVIYFLKDLVFATTFPGSWFLSALFVSVVLVYGFSRVVGPYITIIISLCFSCYFYHISAIPDQYHDLYNWYAETIRPDVKLSFPANMIWVSIGQLIGLHLGSIESSKKWLKPLSVVMLGFSYAIFAYTENPIMFIKFFYTCYFSLLCSFWRNILFSCGNCFHYFFCDIIF